MLGDLFHLYWGQGVLDHPYWEPLLRAMRSYARRGALFFLEGNRDFQAGPEIQRRASALSAGEILLIRSGEKLIYACHGDQLCQDDVGYQRMKRLVRDPALLGLWRSLPGSLRKRFALGLRFFTLRSLRTKAADQLAPSAVALRAIFKRGADFVVSGHRHVFGITPYVAGSRKCAHIELSPWCDSGTFLVSREGVLSFGRYEEGRGITAVEEAERAVGCGAGGESDGDSDTRAG